MLKTHESGNTSAPASIYPGSIAELAADFVVSPGVQAERIATDSRSWLASRERTGFTPIDYFFNTSKRTPAYGLMFSANSGYKPVSPEDRKALEEYARTGLDVVFYQCLPSFPSGQDTNAGVGLAAYEMVSYWAGVTRALEEHKYDVRAVIVDEAGALGDVPALGLDGDGEQATIASLRTYINQHGANDRVLIRPITDMFASEHADSLAAVDIDALRAGKAGELRRTISSDERTMQTARVRLLLGQLSISGARELGLDAFFGDNGVLPEGLPLSALPRTITDYVIEQVVNLDTHMTLRNDLIQDAKRRGTTLPELGVSDRHTMRAGTTKSADRYSVRLVPKGRDALQQVVQVPYAIPAYGSGGDLEGFARNVDLRSGRYGNAYINYKQVRAEDGRCLALLAPTTNT